VVDFIAEWSRKTEIAQERFIRWVGVSRGKFFDWKERYGKANEHNGKVPRDHWLEKWEQQASLAYHRANPLEGYRRMTFMMLDEGIVAVSPASVYRVLNAAGLLERWNQKPSKKGTGFEQPSRAHEHWHIDVAYLNIAGTFYCLCSILDGFSRAVVHWEIREAMRETDVGSTCVLPFEPAMRTDCWRVKICPPSSLRSTTTRGTTISICSRHAKRRSTWPPLPPASSGNRWSGRIRRS
jgi:putative transposase